MPNHACHDEVRSSGRCWKGRGQRQHFLLPPELVWLPRGCLFPRCKIKTYPQKAHLYVQFDLQDEEVLWKKVHCYESNLNPVIDRLEQNQPDEKKDEKLLKLFKDIIDYSLTPTGKRRCSSSSSKIFFLKLIGKIYQAKSSTSRVIPDRSSSADGWGQ